MVTIGIAKICYEFFYFWTGVGSALKSNNQRITMILLETTSYFIIFFFNDEIGDEISWFKILHLVYSNSSNFTKLNN